ncbi:MULTISPECIES: hypothetical protein [Pseudomonas]|uniref:hypothetical protein n=1 Tax=Pseudomonas guariconensis TaxID=1288410 RepID=UPI002097654E|nr:MULTISPECIES: hypothetical protein [Pseudomonas]MCO7596566.1 hypothetical protein [Pseudomonas guariconensis]MCU7222537.1 hypothetical protein [Pseudomonas brassicacearum]
MLPTPRFHWVLKSWHGICYISGTRTITSTATQNKNKTKRLTHNKNKTAEAQLTDSFGEELCLGLPHNQAENNKNCTKKQRLNWLDRTINITSATKAIRLLFTPGLGVVHKLRDLWAGHSTKTRSPAEEQQEHATTSWGASAPHVVSPAYSPWRTAYTIPRVNARIPAHHAAILLFLAEHSFKQCIPC